MPFSNSQKNQIESHLRSHSPRCPVCSGMAWTYDEEPHFVGMLDAEYKTSIEGKVFPLVSVICDRCNYVLHFSACRMGLF